MFKKCISIDSHDECQCNISAVLGSGLATNFVNALGNIITLKNVKSLKTLIKYLIKESLKQNIIRATLHTQGCALTLIIVLFIKAIRQ